MNQRLASFKYGPDNVKNKSDVVPCSLSPTDDGDQISEGDRHWENFTPVTTANRADYLAMLVEDFLEEIKDLYPETPLTPKMYYMVHFPTGIKRYM